MTKGTRQSSRNRKGKPTDDIDKSKSENDDGNSEEIKESKEDSQVKDDGRRSKSPSDGDKGDEINESDQIDEDNLKDSQETVVSPKTKQIKPSSAKNKTKGKDAARKGAEPKKGSLKNPKKPNKTVKRKLDLDEESSSESSTDGEYESTESESEPCETEDEESEINVSFRINKDDLSSDEQISDGSPDQKSRKRASKQRERSRSRARSPKRIKKYRRRNRSRSRSMSRRRSRSHEVRNRQKYHEFERRKEDEQLARIVQMVQEQLKKGNEGTEKSKAKQVNVIKSPSEPAIYTPALRKNDTPRGYATGNDVGNKLSDLDLINVIKNFHLGGSAGSSGRSKKRSRHHDSSD